MDGKCAGAIVYKYYVIDRTNSEVLRREKSFDFYPIDYKDEFPLDIIQPEELVVIVDYMVPDTVTFDKLLGVTENIVWIDHHKTAIDKYEDYKIEGLRVDGIAGCELTWKYFYPDLPTPKVVELLGDYDVWTFKYGDNTRYLQLGIQLCNTNPEDDNWVPWLDPDHDPDYLIADGEIVQDYNINYYKNQIESHGFITAFKAFPEYSVIACNIGLSGSSVFDSVEGDFDLKVPFYYDGSKWTVSLYTDKPWVDCSLIATHYGGGGHKNASGFTTTDLPFLERLKYKK